MSFDLDFAARHRIDLLESEVQQLRYQIEREERRADRYDRRLDEWQMISAGWMLALLQIGGGLLLLAVLPPEMRAFGVVPLITGLFTIILTTYWASDG